MSGTLLPPPSHTALAALPALALDLETTGLDPARDRIVQVAVIAMLGPRILDEPRLDRIVDPGVPIPGTATRIHGIADADVAGAPRFAELADELRRQLAGRVVVGHHIAFDLAVLRHEAARARVPWHDPPCLDVGLLAGALEPTMADPDLEAVAKLLGVRIDRRHNASGDALAAASAFACLVPRLRDRDVRTLGEAQSFASLRSDLLLREAQAGWHAVPGQAADAASSPPPPRIDTYIFERRIAEVMSAPAAMIPAGSTLRDASRLMVERGIGAVLIGTTGGAPEGILTERDLLRATAAGKLDPDTVTVSRIMTAPVECMPADEMLYRALGRMDRRGIRHLCVVDAGGRAVGVISQRDLLRHRARSAGAMGDALAAAGDTPALAVAYAMVPGVASRLIAEGVGGVEIARVVSSELRQLTARATHLAADRLRTERGDAPSPWCLIVLGSGGRGESLLAADQDNALIHAGSGPDNSWFAALGALVADTLDEAGLPRCKGNVMAANSEWRGDLETWRSRVAHWLDRARPEDLLNVDIFFDLAPVAGNASLADALRDEAIRAAAGSTPFIALLAESLAAHRAPVGLFGRLRTVDGRIDLKRWGLLPLVGIARTLALRIGSAARSTPDRLLDAAAAGRLAQSDATLLAEMHSSLAALILRQQLEDLDAGVRPSGRVAVRALGRDGTRRLARDLRRLDEILQALRGAVAG